MITNELTLWGKCKDFRYRTKTVAGATLAYWRARLWGPYPHKVLLAYPHKPELFHSLYSIASELGYSVTNDPLARADIAILFHDTTTQGPDPVRDMLQTRYHLINARCTDISKQKVEEVFQKVFGYGMKVDARTYAGVCVKKSDGNARHDGQIIQCPVEPEGGYIYQRLINNETGDGRVVDIRVPVVRDSIPFVFERYKKMDDRFDNSKEDSPVDTLSIFSREETALLVQFAAEIGLEYGEMDVLRDNDDGRIYVVDVNNTPGVSHDLVKLMAPIFADAFAK